MKTAEEIEKTGYKDSAKTEWLGRGVYFFGTSSGSVKSDGCKEAISWVRYVRKFDNWAVFEAKIHSDSFLDLVENVDHKNLFDTAKQKVVEKYNKMGRSRSDTLRDYVVFKCIDEEFHFDFIRALVDAGRQEYNSYIVRRPQIQICVKKDTCIKDNNIIRKG